MNSNAEPETTEDPIGGLAQLLGGKRTLAEAKGITPEAMESLYGVVRELGVNGRHEEALRGFELLCLYDHENARNWRALGVCRRQLEDYEGAATALAYSGIVGEDDPALQVEICECLVAAGALDAARDMLGAVTAALAEGSVADDALLGRVKLLESRFSQNT